MENMHFITKCSCGVVIAQCRCPGEKVEATIIRGCTICHNSTASVVKSGDNWVIGDGRSFVTLTSQDWKFVSNTIHEHYHGED
jgi:hypothetical protein